MSGICCKSGAQCAPLRDMDAAFGAPSRGPGQPLLPLHGNSPSRALWRGAASGTTPLRGGSSLLLTLSGNRAAAVPGHSPLREQPPEGRFLASRRPHSNPLRAGTYPAPDRGGAPGRRALRITDPLEGLSPAKTRSAARRPPRSRARGRGPPDTPCGPPRSPS